MSSDQQWQDWEEYNLGLQGTPTGSAYNQAGLNDRPRSHDTSPVKAQKHAKRPVNTPQANSHNADFSAGFFLLGVLIAIIAIAGTGAKDPAAYLLGGG